MEGTEPMKNRRTRPKLQPNVTIRDKSDQTVTVEYMFPNGKGGLVSFFFADFGDRHEAQVTLYRTDAGIRVVGPSNQPIYGGLTTDPEI
jgi:hypothetical protein